MRPDATPPGSEPAAPGCPGRFRFATGHGEPFQGAHVGWIHGLEPLSDAACDEIIAIASRFPVVPSTVVQQRGYASHRQCETRDVYHDEQSDALFQLLCEIASDANRDHFQLALTGILRPPQLVAYRPGRGHFGWHSDYGHQPTAPRKITIVVQLSDPGEYDGGQLQVFGTDIEVCPAARGTIILFPAFVSHRVTEVTRGLRRSLVAWVGGPRMA